MKKLFQIDTKFNKLKKSVLVTWMFQVLGEGELEIANQGWSRISSFSQETGAIGQQTPRIGETRPKLKESSAGCTRFLAQLPIFFFHQTLQNSLNFFLIESFLYD
jgi:hypothetical protein